MVEQSNARSSISQTAKSLAETGTNPASKGSFRKLTVSDLPLDYYLVDQQNQLLRWLSDRNQLLPIHFFPLVLSGPQGVGKTSLAESVAKRIAVQLKTPAISTLMISASEFRRRYVSAINLDSINEFRQEFAQLKILVVDGIEQLKNSRQTQLELIQLLDVFDRSDRRLILTSRETTASSLNFLPQLASRLSAGLTIPIDRPSEQVRAEIITGLVGKLGINIDSDGVDLLAKSMSGSAIDIYQSLIDLELHAGNQTLTLEVVTKYLDSTNGQFSVSMADIGKLVSREFDVKLKDMCGKTRRQMVVDARAVAMYLARDLLEISYQKIGNYFGKRDHSTVRHSVQQVELKKSGDESYISWLEQLKSRLTNR